MANIIEEKLLKDQEKQAREAAIKAEEDAKRKERDDAIAALKTAGIPQSKDAPTTKGSWGGYTPDQIEQGKQFLKSALSTRVPSQDIQSPEMEQPAQATSMQQAPSMSQPMERRPDFGAGLAFQAADLEAKAGQDLMKAEGEAAKSKQLFIESEMQRVQDEENKRAQEKAIVQQEISDLEKEYADTKLTSPDIWGQASTGGKILLALGAILSSASNQGAQAFRTGIQNAIDRDIDLQKANLAKKKTSIEGKKGAYAQLLDKYKDEDLAKNRFNALVLDKIGAELEAKSVGAKSDLIKAKASEKKAEVQMMKDKLDSEFGLKREAQRASLSKAAAPKELGSTEKGRFDNISMALRAVNDAESALKKGVNTFSVKGDNDFTLAAREFSEAIGRMQSGGAINKDEEERFRAMLPTVLDDKDIQFKKLQRAREMLEGRLNTLGIESPSQVKAQKEAALGIK